MVHHVVVHHAMVHHHVTAHHLVVHHAVMHGACGGSGDGAGGQYNNCRSECDKLHESVLSAPRSAVVPAALPVPVFARPEQFDSTMNKRDCYILSVTRIMYRSATL